MEKQPTPDHASNEKLQASTSMTVKNNTDIPVSFENWTCGFGILIDTVNCQPKTDGKVKAEYVWYDFRVKDMNNNVLDTLTGVYYSHEVILSQNNDGIFTLSKK